MNILIISSSYAPEQTGIGPYSAGLAQFLAQKGHRVSVICANPSFPQWRIYDGFAARKWSTMVEHGVTVYRCPVFIPTQISGVSRAMHYLSFGFSSLFPMLRVAFFQRPDAVICVVPTLVAAPGALLASVCVGATSWLHVQDFEIEAAFATGQLPSGGLISKIALWFERSILKLFDHASSISFEMCCKLVNNGIDADAVHEFRNWAEIDTIRPIVRSIYRDRWSIHRPHVALYSGSIGKKQGIEIIIESARLLHKRYDLQFVICGQGPGLPDLRRLADGLDNVTFKELQPAAALSELLGLATVHLLPQTADVADLVLPSKMANMLASGRPIVATAAAGTGLARELADCGIFTMPEDGPAFANAIERLLDDDSLRNLFGIEARKRAVKNWDRNEILNKFAEQLLALCRERV